MNAERWARINDLFHRVADLPPADRDALLARECGTDVTLRAEIIRLLDNDDGSGTCKETDLFQRVESRTDRAGEASRSSPAHDPFLGRVLGAYRLTERLGAGGMGVVYRAERADGLYQQEVAVKLIRAERATDWMLRRFEFERRTLAALEHPCIARLFDGGTTEDGSPYFVMELVRGEPIDRYCERAKLPVEARLRLFLEVCRAVHHAHQSLVVHCDLKPANILIDGRGMPRLLDFGIARFLEEEPESAEGAPTRTMARVLTPEYASPEQLSGGAVTTAIDVYSLGVVLYELLAGCRPFESDSRSLLTWERLVREQTPARPSSRVLGGPRTDTVSALRGDLDRIVLMALRTEPERRYASVRELADDIERHLAGEPVRARPSSFGYLASKFIGRHRVAVVAAVAVLAALLVGLISAQRSERVAAAEALHARAEADSFQSIAAFLMDGFLPAHPSDDPAWQERARTRVLAQSEQVRRQYAQSDHERANLLDTLGQVCRRLDLVDDAKTLMDEAASIRERSFGRNSIEFAISLRSQGQLAYDRGDFARGVEVLTEALAIHRAAGGSTHADPAAIANDLGACLRNLGRGAEAEALHREALALRRESGDHTLPVAESLNNLAGIHLGRGEAKAAVPWFEESLAIREMILGKDHLLTVQTVSNLALAYWRSDRRDDALQAMERAEAGYRALGIDGEDGLGVVLSNLATMQMTMKDLDGAARSIEEGLALQKRRLREDHPLIALSMSRLAALQHARQRDDLAREAWIEAVRIRRASNDAVRELADALSGYAAFLAEINACDEAKPLLEEALALHRDRAIDDPVTQARANYALGDCLDKSGDPAAAKARLEAAVEAIGRAPQASDAERAKIRERLEKLVPADGSQTQPSP